MKTTIFAFGVLLPLLALSGCNLCLRGDASCVHECNTSADCADGKVCVHEHAHDADRDTCENPCVYDEAGHPNFYCPDSPLGTACRTDDDQPFCPPMLSVAR
jgi:hypothetical protein